MRSSLLICRRHQGRFTDGATSPRSSSLAGRLQHGHCAMPAVAAGDVAYVATDVGLWMSLPAFGPALAIVGLVIFIVRRDRRSDPTGVDGVDDPPMERNDVL